MARTMSIPDDVLAAIKEIRKLGGYPSDAATLWAIVRMASPGIIAHYSGYQYRPDTKSVPIQYAPSTNPVPKGSTYPVPTQYDSRTDYVPLAETNPIPTVYQPSTEEDDPTLAAMAAIDFDADI